MPAQAAKINESDATYSSRNQAPEATDAIDIYPLRCKMRSQQRSVIDATWITYGTTIEIQV